MNDVLKITTTGMSMNSPSEIVKVVNGLAERKTKMSVSKTFVLSLLGGAYIALGGLLAIMIGGGIPEIAAANPGLQKFLMGAVFPLGLILVVLAGAELFTGNTAYFVPSVLNKRIRVMLPLKNWVIVYGGNFVGALFVAFFLAYMTDIFAGGSWLETVVGIGEAKTSAPFYKVFLKGVGCNWLVALALWLGMAAQDVSGKILGVWFPVMAFVALGFEHCVANMFFIPTAIFYGADITWGEFIVNNLVPATLGNIFGGGLLVGMAYWYCFDRK